MSDAKNSPVMISKKLDKGGHEDKIDAASEIAVSIYCNWCDEGETFFNDSEAYEAGYRFCSDGRKEGIACWGCQSHKQ